jgi:hypothetical protein
MQLQEMQKDVSKESLRDINEISPPKKIQGTNDEFRISAIRFYQGNMDERLSQPKRVTSRFVGMNEDSANNTIDYTPYDNLKGTLTNTFQAKSSMSTAPDSNNKRFFT